MRNNILNIALALILCSLFVSVGLRAENQAVDADESVVVRERLIQRVVLEEVELLENSVLTPQQVRDVSQKYTARPVSMIEINQLRHELSELYVGLGYVNSGVTLPEQSLNDGVLRLTAREGQIDEVVVVSKSRLRESYLRRETLRWLPDGPLNVVALRDALRIAERDPRIGTINARLVPLEEPGQARLLLDVDAGRASKAWAVVNNHRPPSVGDIQGTVGVRHMNLFGYGESLELSGSMSDGASAGTIRVGRPIGPGQLEAWYGIGDAVLVEAPFDDLDVESRTWGGGVRYRLDVQTTARRMLKAHVSLERKKSRTELLGIPFSFSPGSLNGHSRATILETALQSRWDFQRHMISVMAAARIGVDAFGATQLADDPDGRFALTRLQLASLHRLSIAKRNFEAMLRVRGQYTRDTLPAFEKVAMGGANSVRGYRENTLLRDRSFEGSMEFRAPIPIGNNHRLTPLLFVDAARGGNVRQLGNEEQGEWIYGAGVGLRWWSRIGVFANIFWGESLKNRSAGSNLQDDGVHLEVGYERAF